MLLEGYERNKSKLELLEIWSLKKVSRPSNQSRNNLFLLYFSFLLSLSLMFARKPQRSKFCLFAKKSIFDAEVVRSKFFGTAPIFFRIFPFFGFLSTIGGTRWPRWSDRSAEKLAEKNWHLFDCVWFYFSFIWPAGPDPIKKISALIYATLEFELSDWLI